MISSSRYFHLEVKLCPGNGLESTRNQRTTQTYSQGKDLRDTIKNYDKNVQQRSIRCYAQQVFLQECVGSEYPCLNKPVDMTTTSQRMVIFSIRLKAFHKTAKSHIWMTIYRQLTFVSIPVGF